MKKELLKKLGVERKKYVFKTILIKYIHINYFSLGGNGKD
jgi:hypothetical protein